jgi:GMP synthase (glutamine-hydrolysing)
MKFLVIQHLEIEPAALIGEAIVDAGHTFETVHLYNNDPVPSSLHAFNGLVVMGGSMSANDLHLSYIKDELALLKSAIEADFPVIGICLGAQLLARAGGGEITPAAIRELGWHPVFPTDTAASDPLFRYLHKPLLNVFQWHGETFSLPSGATLLATHPAVPHQAFRMGRSQYGLQFHIEVDEHVIDACVEAGASERQELGTEGVELLRKQTGDDLPTARNVCRKMVAAWLEMCG